MGKRKEMQSCPGNRESRRIHVSMHVRVFARRRSLPQHGDLVLDAALLPLQSLFGDALHRKHAARQLLLGQDHLRERSSVNTKKRNIA